MSLFYEFYKGIIAENPIFRLTLSLCSVLAVTTTATSAAGMGAAVIFVMTLSNLVVSLFRRFIQPKVRVPVFIIVIATFVTMVQMIFEAYFPFLNQALGIYLPLIVVNCIILARAEVFASKKSILPSMMDGLGMGVGYAWAVLLIGSIREVFGFGTIFGFEVFGQWYNAPNLVILPPGAFIIIGLLMGAINLINVKS